MARQVECYVELATTLVRLARFSEAEQQLSKGLTVDPECGKAWLLRGKVRIKQGHLLDAKRDFDEAVMREEVRTNALLSRALYFERVRAARVCARLAVTSGPAHFRSATTAPVFGTAALRSAAIRPLCVPTSTAAR